MKCAICRTGDTAPGHANVVLQRDQAVVVIKDVPAEICDTCGEYYLADKEAEWVMRMAEDAVGKGSELEVLRYAA